MMRRGVVGSTLPLRSPTSEALTMHATGGSPAATSNTSRRTSTAGEADKAPNSEVRGSALRRAGKRSSAASAAAARCTQAVCWQVQRLSNTTRRARRTGCRAISLPPSNAT